MIFFSQIQKKLDKRKESMDDLNNLKLANFVGEKAESIRNKPNLVFRFLKDVLDELSRYGMFFVVTPFLRGLEHMKRGNLLRTTCGKRDEVQGWKAIRGVSHIQGI